MKKNTPATIFARLHPDASGCWLWSGHISKKGYGEVQFNGRKNKVHRVIYEMTHGPIPDGLTIDHLCRVRRCGNPAHLEVVSVRENVLRGIGPSALNARKTHCGRGHAYDRSNTYFGINGRACRTCHRERIRRRYYSMRTGVSR